MSDLTKSLDELSPKKRALLKLLREEERADRCTQRIPLRPDSETVPLSFAQQRLWFLTQSQPGSATYNVAAAYRLVGSLNINALRRALSDIGRRHEVLRAIFVVKNGEPIQLIDSAQQVKLRVIDLEHFPDDARESEALRLASQDAVTSFDLSHGPLIRPTLFRLSSERHVLHMVLHHIACDGWSMSVLFDEMASLYTAFSLGTASPLPELPIQYADYADWQRKEFTREVLGKQLAYWKEQLKNPPSLLKLPTDRPRPPIQSFCGARQRLVLSAGFVSRLKNFAERCNVTPFVLMLVAFQSLLVRESGQKDVIVGAPVSGRTRTELEGLIGFFANVLPLRMNFSDDPTVAEVLRRAREVTLAAQENKDVPFEKLVEELGLVRDLSYSPLFQAGFAFHASAPMPSLPDVICARLIVDTKTAKWDLTLEVLEEGDTYCCVFEFSTALFDDSTISRMMRHFEVLLEALTARPEHKISQLPLLTVQECNEILVEWNDTGSDYAKQRSVVQMFEAQAGEGPDRLAVASSSGQLTYGELNKKANQLARYLKERGVGREVLVGVCMERSVELVVGLLGVLKAGGAYVPLDPAYPAERLAFMLEDAGAPVLLTQQGLLQKLPESAAEVICLDQEEDQIAGQSGDNLGLSAEANNLAYVIYTSGSTGKPKGVAIEHGGLLNLIHWHQRTYEVSEKDRATQLAAQAFDASVWELWPYLTAGASIHIPDEETRSSPAALMQWLGEERITLTFLATPLAEAALEVDPPKNLCLKAMLTGGDRLHRAPERELPFRLMNHYGPTENTVVATYCEVRPNEAGVPPIGRPISNTQLYVLDQGMQPVPVGVAGELYIGGESLARGYHQRPELTAEKFVANPFRSEVGARLYKTGDLVRYRADGAVEFLGRMDDQVKIRGFRIELGEIESLLATHQLIRDCVVVVREAAPGQKRLVGYLAVDRERTPSQEELRTFLSKRLPSYMIPVHFVLLDALPLTANGKVDREALPEPHMVSDSLPEYAKARTPVEELLAEIWSQVLKRPRIGIHDNFFEQGGDSILSIQVTGKANQHGLQISPKQIFQHPTIAELAAVANRLPVWSEEQGEVTGTAPLTPIQQWFFEQEFANPHHFNQAMLFEVHRRFDPSILKQAVDHLNARHDGLRLRFFKSNGTWQQFCTAIDAEVPVALHDLSRVSHHERRRAIEEIATDIQQGLNLSNGPLLRIAWFDMGGAEPDRLLVAAHHLVVDGVSWRILLEDFVNICEALSEGKDFDPPPKGISFKRWAERLAKIGRDKGLAQESGYWAQVLNQGFAPLPLDGEPNGPNIVRSASVIRTQLDAVETRKLLLEAPAAHRATINELLLTALAKALQEWTGSTSLLVDMEGHGREELSPGFDSSKTVGWFTTIFPVVLDMQSNGSLPEVLRHVKERMRSLPNHGIGYGVLRYLSDDATRRHLESLPHAQLLFNYLGQFDRTWPCSWLSVAPESAGPLHSPSNHRPYLIEVSCGVYDGCLLTDWTYSELLHHRQTINALAQRFLSVLCRLANRLEPSETNTPSREDFSAAGMSQRDFDTLLGRINQSAERPSQ